MARSLVRLIDIIEQEAAIRRLLQYCPYSILRQVRVRTYPAGEFELKQGEIHPTFYIIVKGEADIFTISEHGKKYFQTTYHSGDVIGEMEIFQQKPYISYVQARKEMTVLEIERDIFVQWIQLDQHFNRLFIQKLCETSYQMFNRMGTNNLYSLKQRICQYLLDQVQVKKQCEIVVHSEELAQKMAVTQRSVNRILKELKDMGHIELSRGKIRILYPEKLELLSQKKEK